MIMEEIWKPIKDWEGMYEISNLGRVKSLARYVNHPRHGQYFRKERILKSKISRGYHCVMLSLDSSVKYVRVHRLIATAFIPNPMKYEVVNHLNGIKTDNRIENLEWCTSSENMSHAHRIGLSKKKGTDHHGAKLNDQQVKEIRRLYKDKIYNQYELADMYGMSVTTMCNITKGKTWRHIL